jgi:hypothetical protein
MAVAVVLSRSDISLELNPSQYVSSRTSRSSGLSRAREFLPVARFLPGDPKHFRAQILSGGRAISPAAKVAVDAVVAGRVGRHEPLFSLQFHTLPQMRL